MILVKSNLLNDVAVLTDYGNDSKVAIQDGNN